MTKNLLCILLQSSFSPVVIPKPEGGSRRRKGRDVVQVAIVKIGPEPEDTF